MRAAADPELLTGYTPHLSYLPGEAVDVHLSAPEPVTVRLVRLTGPAADDGVPTAPVVGAPSFEVTAPGVHPLPTGSWARVRIAEPASCDVGFWLLPTHRRPTRRTVVALRRGAAHVSLGTDAHGALEVRAGVDGDSDGTAGAVPVDLALARMRWQQVEVRVEPEEVVVVLTVRSQSREVRVPLATALGGALGPLEVTFAASADAQPSGFFDGKVDRPVVGGVEIRTEPDQLGDALRDPEGVVVGRLVNHPTRGVTGHTWRDQTGRWTDDPSLYTAVHFHSDDLDDAGWPVAATLTLPADLTSGLYAVETRSGAQRDWLPFAVRAATPAAVTVLLPTFTYLAYANEAPFAPHVPVREDSRDSYATRHALTSLYSYHDDGSGVAYASLRRPLLNLRPDYRYWLTGYPHGPGADLAILAFLDHLGVDHDVVTDHDLDADPTLLDGRRALVTGCHPEYWSRRMMAALEGWLDVSGRLLYFGGNGLYAMVATLPDAPHLLELRRRGAEVGLWEAEPGEAVMAATGEVGGLWKHHRPTPTRITGLCYCAMGFTAGSGYRVRPEALGPRTAFLMDGLPGDVLSGERLLGDEGAWFGAAAGYECDRADPGRGTPEHAVVLASSDTLPEGYEAADPSGERRAEVVFFETAGGGAVFSVGSIAWAGALAVDGFDNAVARLTANAVRRFAAADPFTQP